jgi:ABC-2 type transport system permease protein
MRDGAIVAAKFSACLVVIVALLATTTLYPWWVNAIQPFPMTPLLAAYLGLFLLAAACVAYGMFVSSLTDSQVLAAFLTAMPLLLLWLLSWNEATTSLEVLPIVRAISLFNHFQPFTVGVIDVRDVFYFVFLAGVFVWATLQVLAARQWRGRR